MTTIRIPAGKTRMIAHRGLSGIEKENTNASFVAAGNRSYWGIETDVHRTADGRIVAIHDENTERLTGRSLVIAETGFDTLRSIPLLGKDGSEGRIDQRIPTLEEYISICRTYEKVSVLELKGNPDRETVRGILETVDRLGWLENTVFISFSYDSLTAVRSFLPGQPVQFLTKRPDDAVISAIRRDRFDLDAYHRELTEEMIRTLHADGLQVNCWTVNAPEDAQRLIGWGVDFISTNILEAEPAL